MTPKFHERYRPVTSRPFLSNPLYTEYRPCCLLNPYVTCYWSAVSGPEREENGEVLVIPDTCMDIVIRINHTRQTVSGYLCSIQDKPFFSNSAQGGDEISVFAIRFYFWACHLFLDLDFRETANQNLEIAQLGREWRTWLEPFLELHSVEEKISWTERFLLEKVNGIAFNANLFNSFQKMVDKKGVMTVKELCEYSCISQRQMERQFLQAVGLPMKRVAGLVRYQNVWRDVIGVDPFQIQDAVYRYGYVDQAHLLKEFKRFHGITPREAKQLALLSR